MKYDVIVSKGGDVTFNSTKVAKRVASYWAMSLDLYGKDSLLGGIRKRANKETLKELIVCGIRIKLP